MKLARGLLSTGLLVGLLLTSGCGKSDDQPTRFNQTLGGTPAGAPTAAGSIDPGILRDPKDYTPESYQPLEGEAPAGAAEGPEAEQIRNVISGLVDSAFHLEIESVLDTFVPGQVAALAEEDEYLQSFDDLKTALSSVFDVFESKAPEAAPEDSPDLEELLQVLTNVLANAMTISVLDEENAVATFHLDRIEIPDEVKAWIAEAGQTYAATTAQESPGTPGSPPETASAPEGFTPDMFDNLPSVELPLPLRKVDEAWRLVLPFTLEDQHAELISEGAMIFTSLSRDFAQAVTELEALDVQTVMQIARQVGGRHTPAIMGWFARTQLAFASLMEAQAQPEEEAAEADGDQAEPEEEEEPEEPPDGRRGRGRGRQP